MSNKTPREDIRAIIMWETFRVTFQAREKLTGEISFRLQFNIFLYWFRSYYFEFKKILFLLLF